MRFLSQMSLTLLCATVFSITAPADEPVTLIGTIVKWRYPNAEIGKSQMCVGGIDDNGMKREGSSIGLIAEYHRSANLPSDSKLVVIRLVACQQFSVKCENLVNRVTSRHCSL